MKRIGDELIKGEYESWLDLDEDENQIKGLREVAQAQKESCEKEVQGAIDNILTEATKEASNGRKLEYFFVDKLIALKQKHLGGER